jgi:hypothetical protein
MGNSVFCGLAGEAEAYYYDVTEERGNSVKRAFGRKYFLVVPKIPLREEQLSIEVKTKNLIDPDYDVVTVNGQERATFLDAQPSKDSVEKKLQDICLFVRNPLKQTQVQRGAVQFKVTPFKGDYQIIHSQDYLPEGCLNMGKIRVFGFE